MSLNLQSPPRPTRLIEMPTFENSQTRRFGRETLVLPALAGEVASAQEQQLSELSEREEVLQHLKEEYQKVLNEIKLVEEHASAVSRKICLAEGDIGQKKTECSDVQRRVDENIRTEQHLAAHLELLKEKLQKDDRVYKQCTTKMKRHSESVENSESCQPIRKEISNQEEKNGRLQREVEHLRPSVGGCDEVIGVTEERRLVQAEVAHLKEQLKALENRIFQRRLEVKGEQERQAELRKENELISKRNVAQLTRLKRQLQEVVARNRHWNEEACRLEKSIEETRNKIDGIRPHTNPHAT